MVDLRAISPLQGQDAVEMPGVTICEVPTRLITLIAPFAGQDGALAEAMEAQFGFGFPKPGEVLGEGSLQCRWFGHRQAILIGATEPESMQEVAMITDQSDGWVAVQVCGAHAEQVLARVIPVDLAEVAFPKNSTARTVCGHMMISVTRMGEDRFEIMGFRSMAQSLVHEIGQAAGLVAARAGLP
ncbi:sarcosine oxidase subunit gamma [uncultured Pelagimonas sp.]|uniref:sarcosine oxidase subunit gamma n=1 Tax=uncultured Pelagimonas sp. TaxID=1618102 RepID=UPI00262ED7E7|nr:sarcosine oxidase subunit gamma [uncultured Pelagimonas sp.]